MLATFDHGRYQVADLRLLKRETVSVCIPTRDTAATIGATVAALDELREAGLVDQLLIVDAASRDGTADLALAAGADVVQEADLLPELGAVKGKGDAMWRALSVIDGDLVVYLDGDVKDFGAHYVTGLLGPLLEAHQIDFVKGFYRRPLTIDELEIADGGGRVTELTARPLLELFMPELASFRQPLAGECASRRALLTEIPYFTGYGVEMGMLIEVWRRVGIERMAQVDLGSKRNSHQSLAELAEMSREVVAALALQLAASEEGQDGWPGVRPARSRRVSQRQPIASLAGSSSSV